MDNETTTVVILSVRITLPTEEAEPIVRSYDRSGDGRLFLRQLSGWDVEVATLDLEEEES